MSTTDTTELPLTGVIDVNGATVRYYRQRAGIDQRGNPTSITQHKLAKDTRLARSYISEIETGVKKPRRLAAEKIAEVLGVKVEDLVKSPPEATD